MKNLYRHLFLSAALLHMTADAAASAPEVAEKKSIVPSKYSGKYKNGGSDDLANFINEQCKGKEGFEYTAFFQLCRVNGLDDAKVSHYEQLVNDKAHGSQGRARMTLRNILAAKVRKDGSIKDLAGETHEMLLAKPAVSGAAATAAAAASESKEAPATSEDSQTE